MNIKPGLYRMRNGKRVRVLCVDAPGDWPIIGYYDGNDGEHEIASWRESGEYWLDSARREGGHANDLISEWREPEVIEGYMVIGGKHSSLDALTTSFLHKHKFKAGAGSKLFKVTATEVME